MDALPEFPEPEESGGTFAENARIKAVQTSLRCPWLTLADDSGLEVDALGGAPGVRSARYAGQGAGDRANLELLLRNLEGVPMERRGARFRCVLAVARQGELLAEFEGKVEGRIALEPRGDGGFGYDPLFVPQGWELTFAQMDAAAKHALSHRGEAMRKFREWLEREGRKWE